MVHPGPEHPLGAQWRPAHISRGNILPADWCFKGLRAKCKTILQALWLPSPAPSSSLLLLMCLQKSFESVVWVTISRTSPARTFLSWSQWTLHLIERKAVCWVFFFFVFLLSWPRKLSFSKLKSFEVGVCYLSGNAEGLPLPYISL